MPRVLIIDDDIDFNLISKSLLVSRGFNVVTCTNWDQANLLLDTFNPSVILLDIFLADIDGLEICKKLKSSPGTVDIPIIIISGYPKVAETAVYQFGADSFISKPFEINDLVANIHRTLSHKYVSA